MMDLSELCNDPDLGACAFEIQRHTGGMTSGSEGAWVENAPSIVPAFGNVQPAKEDDMLKFLPEGEREGNAIRIYCAQEIRKGNGRDKESDVIVWNGSYYRVAFAKPWNSFGYWFAIATGFAHG